jgi:nicotinamidase-related amidase
MLSFHYTVDLNKNINMEEHRIKKALLIIDLQEDFISPNGAFMQSHVKANHIISNLSVILPHFRDQNGIVVWIKSDYSKPELEPKYLIRPEGEQFKNIPLNNDFLSGTHKIFPLCVPGTDGEKFIPEIQTLLNEEHDLVICKKFYSAFTSTTLADVLKNVNEVHICGLMTNVCVQATATDVFFHGYRIFIWTDCLGYRRDIEKHSSI